MRKIVILMLSLVLTIACLSGCAKKKQSDSNNQPNEAEDEKEINICGDVIVEYEEFLELAKEIPFNTKTYPGMHEKTEYWEYTEEDDFSDSIIMIILKNYASLEFKEYTVEDFPELELEAIKNMSVGTGIALRAQYLGVDVRLPNGGIACCRNNLNHDEFNAMIKIKLKEVGKDKVIEAVDYLVENYEEFMLVYPVSAEEEWIVW